MIVNAESADNDKEEDAPATKFKKAKEPK